MLHACFSLPVIRRLVFLTNFRLDAEQENTKFRVDDEWKNWRVITRVERDLALGCVTYVIIREGTILDGVKFTRFKVQLATKLARLRHSLPPPLHLFSIRRRIEFTAIFEYCFEK